MLDFDRPPQCPRLKPCFSLCSIQGFNHSRGQNKITCDVAHDTSNSWLQITFDLVLDNHEPYKVTDTYAVSSMQQFLCGCRGWTSLCCHDGQVHMRTVIFIVLMFFVITYQIQCWEANFKFVSQNKLLESWESRSVAWIQFEHCIKGFCGFIQDGGGGRHKTSTGPSQLVTGIKFVVVLKFKAPNHNPN